MVREVRRLLHRGPFTLSQMVAELGAPREVVRSSLQFWLDRGDVRVEAGRRAHRSCGAHGSCGSCNPGRSEAGPAGAGPAVYFWEARHGEVGTAAVGES